jgi:hypothetical protein
LPIQCHTPQLHRSRLQCQAQHLLEQIFHCLEMLFAKIGNGPEIGLIAGRQDSKSDVFHQLLLDPARRKHSHAIPVITTCCSISVFKTLKGMKIADVAKLLRFGLREWQGLVDIILRRNLLDY